MIVSDLILKFMKKVKFFLKIDTLVYNIGFEPITLGL